MAVGKQIDIVTIEPGVIDAIGDFVAFPSTGSLTIPFAMPAWNASFEYRTEYLGPPKIRTLTGFERQGIVGFRPYMSINLRNTSRTDTTRIAELLSYVGTWGATNRPAIDLDPPNPPSVPDRNIPTVFRITPNTNAGLAQVYNIETPTVEINRELTINSQIISISFSGLYITNSIPNSIIV